MAIIGLVPVLVAVKAETFPVPPAASPIAVFEFVQAVVVPAMEVVKLLAGTLLPLQYARFGSEDVMAGVGLTVIV